MNTQPVQAPVPPARPELHSREVGAAIPMIQSVLTAMVAFIFFTWGASVFGNNLLKSLRWGFGAAVVTLTVFWLYLLWRWIQQTTDRVFAVPAPAASGPAPAQTVTVWIKREEGGGFTQSERVDFGASASTMRQLASGLISGKPFTREAWVSTGILTDDKHRKIKAEMLERGLLKLKNTSNPRMGVELTPEGRQVMQQILNSPTPPHWGA